MCGDVGEGHLGGLTSAPPLLSPARALRRSCLVSTFLPLSRRAAPVHLDIRRSRRVKVRKRIEWLSTRRPTHPKSRPLVCLSPNPPARPAAYDEWGEGGDRLYFYTYEAFRPKPVIVTSGRKGFIGILSRADAKILTWGRRPAGEKSAASSSSDFVLVWKLCQS